MAHGHLKRQPTASEACFRLQDALRTRYSSTTEDSTNERMWPPDLGTGWLSPSEQVYRKRRGHGVSFGVSSAQSVFSGTHSPAPPAQSTRYLVLDTDLQRGFANYSLVAQPSCTSTDTCRQALLPTEVELFQSCRHASGLSSTGVCNLCISGARHQARHGVMRHGVNRVQPL